VFESSIKGGGFFIFFKTRAKLGGVKQAEKAQAEAIKRDLVTLQIARILKEQDLALEREKLETIELAVEPKIKIDLYQYIKPIEVDIYQSIETIELEITEIEEEIRRKNNALALILILVLL